MDSQFQADQLNLMLQTQNQESQKLTFPEQSPATTEFFQNLKQADPTKKSEFAVPAKKQKGKKEKREYQNSDDELDYYLDEDFKKSNNANVDQTQTSNLSIEESSGSDKKPFSDLKESSSHLQPSDPQNKPMIDNQQVSLDPVLQNQGTSQPSTDASKIRIVNAIGQVEEAIKESKVYQEIGIFNLLLNILEACQYLFQEMQIPQNARISLFEVIQFDQTNLQELTTNIERLALIAQIIDEFGQFLRNQNLYSVRVQRMVTKCHSIILVDEEVKMVEIIEDADKYFRILITSGNLKMFRVMKQ
eukprot:403345281